MTKEIILLNYVFYLSNSSLYITNLDNYKIIKKYKYSNEIKKIIQSKIHKVLQDECAKIIQEVHDIINLVKYIQ